VLWKDSLKEEHGLDHIFLHEPRQRRSWLIFDVGQDMKWLRTDEYQEVVATLHACQHFLSRSASDVTYWKWVFIALHNVVQGCMVIVLTRSDSFGAKDAKQERAWLEAYEKGSPFPTDQEKLLSFLDLYEKIKKKGTLQYSSVERFVPEGSQSRSMKKLNAIRNEFIHFTPKGWSLELSSAPQIAIDCLDVAAFLAKHSNRFMLSTSFKEGQLIDLIQGLKKQFATIK
jgi:hypothetical protein